MFKLTKRFKSPSNLYSLDSNASRIAEISVSVKSATFFLDQHLHYLKSYMKSESTP